VKLAVNMLYPGYDNIIRETAVCTEQPTPVAALAVGVKVRDLTARVNAGIRSSRASDFNVFIRDPAERLFDALLHAITVVLALPTVVGRTVVFDANRDAHSRRHSGAVGTQEGKESINVCAC